MSNRIIRISDRRPDEALSALNRLTGVTWDNLPVSLKHLVKQKEFETMENRQEKGTGLKRAGL